MNKHALLSPSSAERWLNCPLAPRLEAKLPYRPSEDAEIGTLAHSVCETAAKKYFGMIKQNSYTRTIKKLQTNPLWDDEMLRTSEIYVEHLAERAMSFQTTPHVALEIKVDISDFVPESFGRCDCVMFGDDTLIITDYKNGKGVPVSATANPQLMLYALGAISLYKPLFGNNIQNIEICVDQPRLNSYEQWSCSKDELLEWGEEIKPLAQMAYTGFGEYHAGKWCRFCRANGLCKAQAEQQISAFDDFAEVIAQNITGLLSPEDMSAVLKKGEILIDWFNAVKKEALAKLLQGIEIPDFKIVEGRSSRTWANQDKALETLESSGIEKAIIYDRVPKTLAQLEKLLGKAKFDELVGEYVVRSKGKPTLAPKNDKRPEFNSAVIDFETISDNNENEESKS